MNKEVNYVLQGFLLTLVVIGAFKFSGLLFSIPAPAQSEETAGYCGTIAEAAPSLNPTAEIGKNIFRENCASCHSLRKDLTGPALTGALSRVTDRKLLYKWIRNPSAVLKSGNTYFNGLVKKYDGLMMTGFPGLTDGEIDAVLEFISAYSTPPPITAE
ncbi:c-type cytochrome [Niastella populi]|uniref:Cytochrome c domain-containing protein n=1 Tax=Niastella populi TaxID=550983 RepID=A0A1V9EL43_9BACT|nr:cytochrome c [Niastella populi]OQP46664.1 hypothetical protein A4R26_08045 [Niastella populi]